jgi:hypothetical protein
MLAVFFLLLAACHPKPSSQDIAMNSTDSLTLRMQGSLFQTPFMNKVGRTDDAQQEPYLLFQGEEYFIKFCEGKVTREEVRKLMGKPIEWQGSLHNGSWDICPGDPDYMQSRMGKYVAIESITTSPEPLLTYSDGSGNFYQINANTLRYVPVKPAQSSSGNYDGGTYTVKAIGPEQFAYLKTAFEKAHTATADHTDTRGMGTGQLGFTNATVDWTVILKMGSVEKEELEKLLNVLRTSN